MNAYDELFTFDNLYSSYKNCLRGVRWKGSTQRFVLNDLVYINLLQKELHNRNYIRYGFHEFNIIERGKERHIMALPIRERVVQKCLCDYCINPLLSKSFIYDNGACVKGKGINFTIKRLDKHLFNYFTHYGNQGYCLTFDLHHFFDSIDHQILKGKLRTKILNNDIYNLTCGLIDDFKGDKGLGLGSQISQISALFYLSDLDHYIKEQLHCKYYGRYMDDFYIISNNYETLMESREIVVDKLHELKLEINEKKTKIYKLASGFYFMKMKVRLTDTGKVLHTMTTKTFKRMKKKIGKVENKESVLASWNAYVKRFDCYFKLKRFYDLHVFKYIIN